MTRPLPKEKSVSRREYLERMEFDEDVCLEDIYRRYRLLLNRYNTGDIEADEFAEIETAFVFLSHQILKVNYFDILGLPTDINDDELIKETYLLLLNKSDNISNEILRASYVDRLQQAYQVLRNPKMRAYYRSTLSLETSNTRPDQHGQNLFATHEDKTSDYESIDAIAIVNSNSSNNLIKELFEERYRSDLVPEILLYLMVKKIKRQEPLNNEYQFQIVKIIKKYNLSYRLIHDTLHNKFESGVLKVNKRQLRDFTILIYKLSTEGYIP